MKTKKIISILMAMVIMLSTAICSMPTTIAATKSGNTKESDIETQFKPAHYIQGKEDENGKEIYPSQITETNGWTINGKQVSVTALVDAKFLKKDNKGNYTNLNSVTTPSDLKAQVSIKGSSENYHYVSLNKSVSLSSDITINNYTILKISENVVLDLNNHDINLKGQNILVTGEGLDKSTIKNGRIFINNSNITIKNVKLYTGSNYKNDNNKNKIVFNSNCSNISITGCALNNNSESDDSGRIRCNATVNDLYIVNCSAAGNSPYLIKTSSTGSVSKLKISRGSDNASKLCGLVSLINSNNIKITNQDDLNYSFTDCNTISFTSSSINKIVFNRCKKFRLHSTNINEYCSITDCNVFSLIDVPIKGKANFTNSFYFEFDRAKIDKTNEKDCLNNVLSSGLNLTNCYNFIINEARIPVGLNIKNDTSSDKEYFSIKNSYVNNVNIENMKFFTIYKTCRKSTPKNYSLTKCKYYKNYVVRTSSKNAQTHGH